MEIGTELMPVAPSEEVVYGPHMRALPIKRRQFVERYILQAFDNATEAARAAGFKDGPGLPVTAHRLIHDERIQRALVEECQRVNVSFAPLAMRELVWMATDRGGRNQYQAVDRLLRQSGLDTAIQHVHAHTVDPAEMAQKIRQLSVFLGVDPEKMLGSDAAVIDVTPEKP